MFSKLDLVIPDADDFTYEGVSFALDAGTAVYSSLNFMLDHNVEHIIAVAIYARDTVYAAIIDKENLDVNLPGTDEKVSNHIWMLRELNRQSYVIGVLVDLNEAKISDELIHRLKVDLPIIDIEILKKIYRWYERFF